MSSEKLGGNYRATESEKPAWKVERENDLMRKRRIGEVAMGAAAAVLVGIVLSHSAKTSEIMNDEERAKNVKKIEVEGVVFHDGVNARKEPFVDNENPNQLANIDEGGENVVVDYDGEAYYYSNDNDPNGGWYGFEAADLSDELLENNYISQMEANSLISDEKFGDGTVWFNEKYVDIIEPSETNYTMVDGSEEIG